MNGEIDWTDKLLIIIVEENDPLVFILFACSFQQTQYSTYFRDDCCRNNDNNNSTRYDSVWRCPFSDADFFYWSMCFFFQSEMIDNNCHIISLCSVGNIQEWHAMEIVF